MKSLLGSVRFRITIAATLITAVVLILGAVAIVKVVERNLTDIAHEEGSGQESTEHEGNEGSGELSEAAIREIQDGVEAVTDALVVIIPGLILILGVGTWIAVGRALRPVSAISHQVASITDSTLDERVPVPDSDDEISQLATLMNAMLDRLESASDRQQRFVADASHELRSPLSTIKAAAEISQLTNDQEHQLQLAAQVEAEADRMSDLISDLLTLARLEDDPTDQPTDPVNIDTICERAMERIDPDNNEIEPSIEPGLTILGDEPSLERAIHNLVHNATTHANSRVRLTARIHDDTIIIEVEDDGPGIPQHERQTIFERFTRTDESRSRHQGGTGLGLAITRATILRHGGTIAADQSPDLQGARFTINLPHRTQRRSGVSI